ncbi:DUF448 domain-containing protein [Desulforhopalus vacuolatus]|uniref:YlxR family protein n=1 Tax=Desulforhopalus vacuolatus TaxID=40414 RepID=UPI0019641708|nr:DUF448 domain-containing protein [Desulforhopalus vacuolatus]
MTEPIRTCVVCRKKFGKSELERYVWREGKVVADPQKKMAGRGAYCCSSCCRERFLAKKKYWKVVFRIG